MTQADNHTRMFDPYWYPFRLFSKLQFRQLLNLEGIAHQWILPRGLQEKHLYKVTRIGQSCVLFESSTVCSSSSEFKALKHQDVLKVSQGFNRLNLFTYQYGSKRGYPWDPQEGSKFAFVYWTIGVNHFQPYPNRNEPAAQNTDKLQCFFHRCNTLMLCSCDVASSAAHSPVWTELGFMTCLDMRDWNSWATSLQETAQVQASLSVSEIVPDPVTLLLDRPESSPSETKPLPSQCGSLDMGLLKRHTGTTQS